MEFIGGFRAGRWVHFTSLENSDVCEEDWDSEGCSGQVRLSNQPGSS